MYPHNEMHSHDRQDAERRGIATHVLSFCENEFIGGAGHSSLETPDATICDVHAVCLLIRHALSNIDAVA